MDIQASQSPTIKGGNLGALVGSVCAAIAIALGIAILFQAAIVSVDRLIGLGSTFWWLASVTNAIFTLWLFAWTFARSWHVEQRLQQGLDIDAPKLSILANLRSVMRK
jgi:hypothetical protein